MKTEIKLTIKWFPKIIHEIKKLKGIQSDTVNASGKDLVSK